MEKKIAELQTLKNIKKDYVYIKKEEEEKTEPEIMKH